MTTSLQWISQKWPHFENPIVKTITINKIMPVLLSHLNKNSIYASATTIDFIAFIWATNNDVDNFFLSMWICLNKRVYKLLTKGHIFSSCERRYRIEHCNFGSFSRHFLCPSRKHCSVSILLMSDITRPNENICWCLFMYSSFSTAFNDFRFEGASESRMASFIFTFTSLIEKGQK